HVVPGDQIRLTVFGRHLRTGGRAEEVDLGADSLAAGHFCDVGGGFDTDDRNPGGDEVLQQVPVVAGHLDHERVFTQAQPLGHLVGVPLRVRHPRVGVRREVGVVGEDVLTRYVGGKLYQQAL